MLQLNSDVAMRQFGQRLSQLLTKGLLITLSGELGAGKTTLARGIIEGLGHIGPVKSPTYTIVEPYDLTNGMVYHFDFYRLIDPEELEFLGFREYLSEAYLCIIEWPERADWYVGAANLCITIEASTSGRTVFLKANGVAGQDIATRVLDKVMAL